LWYNKFSSNIQNTYFDKGDRIAFYKSISVSGTAKQLFLVIFFSLKGRCRGGQIARVGIFSIKIILPSVEDSNID
jgi:hypothetical protein